MRIAIGLLIAILFVLALRRPLKRYPWIFYIIALGLSAIYVAGYANGLPAWAWKTVMFLFQKNVLGFAFFILVMFATVLPEKSGFRQSLMSVRGELSIIATLLSLGHIFVFAKTYFSASKLALLPANCAIAVCMAGIAVVLLVPLAITSVKKVRKAMSPTAWKKVQLLAYPFFLLLFGHILCFMGISAFRSGGKALVEFAVYAAILVLYCVLKVCVKVSQQRANA